MSRKKIDIDGAEVQRLAGDGLKVTEIAEYFAVDRDTIHGRFSAEIRKGRVNYKIMLRKLILQSAKQGSQGVLLGLARQYLGFGDRSLDENVLDAIEAAGLDQDDLLDLIRRKQELYLSVPKRSFHEFVIKAGYPAPFDKQVEMMRFGISETDTRLLLGSRGYGKTDYITILGVAWDIYMRPFESTNLIITKSANRNAAILAEIASACTKNGMVFEIQNQSRIRVKGLEGKEDSATAVPIKTKSLRGRHPYRTIMDDPVTEDDTSEATRTHARKILNESLKLTTNLILIGQPAHQYDLYADVRGQIKTMEVPYGTIPELDADLEAQRLAGVSEASISASYYLKVLSEGTTPFNAVKYLDSFPTSESAIAFIDPSEGGDYTAITILKQYMQGVAAVGFVYKKAWNHCLEDMAKKCVKYNVKRIAFEVNSTGEQPIELLRRAFPGIGVVGKRAVTNKHSRIMAAGTFAHLIHLSKESDKVYLDHVVKYEYKSKYDDAPDSLASCLEWIGLIRGKS